MRRGIAVNQGASNKIEGLPIIFYWKIDIKMKTPKRIEPLIEEGLVDSVICQLMSGKEALVYVVQCGSELICAKVYKETHRRNFRHSANYTEGRYLKNIRRTREIQKQSYFGKLTQEVAWQNTEINALCQLGAAGVKVPGYINFFEGVLLMELITDSQGNVAPRLNDIRLTKEEARTYHALLINQAVRMLCHGMIHSDLSEYNVLLGSQGPVIIDFPQAIYALDNNNARWLLKRDIDNITKYFSRFAPELVGTDFGSEIWSLYEHGKLNWDTPLTGVPIEKHKPVNVDGLLKTIDLVMKKELAWQRYKQERWTSQRSLAF